MNALTEATTKVTADCGLQVAGCGLRVGGWRIVSRDRSRSRSRLMRGTDLRAGVAGIPFSSDEMVKGKGKDCEIVRF